MSSIEAASKRMNKSPALTLSVHHGLHLNVVNYLYFSCNVADALSSTEQGMRSSGSSSSLRSQNYLENVIQWSTIVRRYRDLKESPKEDND